MTNSIPQPHDTDVTRLARDDVARALAEDVGAGDLTAGLIDPARRARARILAREAAVICGAPWAEAALRALSEALLRRRTAARRDPTLSNGEVGVGTCLPSYS